MTSIGIMASSVVPSTGIDVLFEDFANFTDAPWALVATNPTIVSGRTGTCCQTTGSTGRATYTIPTLSRDETVTVGFAWKISAAAAGVVRIASLWTETNVNEHTRLVYEGATGALTVSRTGTGLGTSASSIITVNAWHYIELQTRIHDTLGTAIVRVDGTTVITANNVDTRNNSASATTAETLRLGPQIAGVTTQYDDLYITTGASAPFKGDITV